MANWSISLVNLSVYLNYHEGTEEECLYKKAFYAFYRWLMRNKYAVHVLLEEKITHKEEYLQNKNKLVYLPELKSKLSKNLGKKEAVMLSIEEPVQSKTMAF